MMSGRSYNGAPTDESGRGAGTITRKVTLNPRSIARLLLLTVLAGLLSPVFAQTSAQLQQLQNLSPEERAALIELLGQTGSTPDRPLSTPQVIESRPLDVAAAPEPTNAETLNSVEQATGLRPFGYDLFAGQPTTFAPATDIPIPVDYLVGPGDTVLVQLFGNENDQLSLVVTREGLLNFPGIGPISVAGLEFSELRRTLEQRISEQMIGVRSSISMGPLRSIRVFVLGDAYRPGSYTVSALSTMTNALFVSGGIHEIGSLRKVQLKRNGTLVRTLDLYDLLLRGDTSDDARLRPGDVIFVPPVGQRAGVSGEVRRPAIYELNGEETVADVLELAGGLLPTAYPQASQVERINAARERTVVSVDLAKEQGLATAVENGDTIQVFSVLEKRTDVVRLTGHVYRPGTFQWRSGMRLSDLISSTEELQPRADLGYVVVRREPPGALEISVFSADLRAALQMKESSQDPQLRPGDRITVFETGADRSGVIEPILADLRLQSGHAAASREVGIAGRVRAPGRYPLEDAMRISDLVRAGGYLDEAAYALQAELTRYRVTADQARETELFTIDLAAALSGDERANILLQPYDVLSIKEIPNWRDLEQASVRGEVRFPGTYPIRRGERLSSLVERAGGLTELAFADGAVFLREDLRAREEQQLEDLAAKVESEIETAAANRAEGDETLTARQALLEQVRETEATGRLVINLRAVIDGRENTDADVILRDRDQLLIPQASQTVTVIGEVQFPTSHIFESGISRKEYIQLSGGVTADADRRRVYVVRADGAVEPGRQSRFFRNRDGGDIRPGDTIVVPLDADRVSALSLWTNVTTIIYNIGVAAAAVASF